MGLTASQRHLDDGSHLSSYGLTSDHEERTGPANQPVRLGGRQSSGRSSWSGGHHAPQRSATADHRLGGRPEGIESSPGSGRYVMLASAGGSRCSISVEDISAHTARDLHVWQASYAQRSGVPSARLPGLTATEYPVSV